MLEESLRAVSPKVSPRIEDRLKTRSKTEADLLASHPGLSREVRVAEKERIDRVISQMSKGSLRENASRSN